MSGSDLNIQGNVQIGGLIRVGVADGLGWCRDAGTVASSRPVKLEGASPVC